MLPLLKETACHTVEEYRHEFSLAWQSEHRQTLQNFSTEVMHLLHPFLLAKQVASRQEVDQVLQKAITDLSNSAIGGTITLVTGVGNLPPGETITPHPS